MTIKQSFMLSYLSSLAISVLAIISIVAMVFFATLGEIPTIANLYKMLTVQKSVTEIESEAFLQLNRVVQRSPELLNLPLNDEVQAMIQDIENQGLKVVIRKNNAFSYFTDGLVESSLEVHAPEYELNNLEPLGTMDNAGKLYRYIKSDFHYLDGSIGSVVILTRESTLFEVFSKWGVGIVVAILLVALLLASYINRRLKRSTIDPIESLALAMQSAPNENNLNEILENFPENHISKDIKQLQLDFKEMWYKLEYLELLRETDESNRAELVSNISHDLKTPITTIIGYVEGLMEGVAATPEKQAYYLKTIHQTANDLNDLIEELFLYSKLEYQELHFETKVINVVELLETIVFEYEDTLPKLTLVSHESELLARIDALHLRRAIVNIIENSLKFVDATKPNPYINLNIFEIDDMIAIKIRDNGMGIHEDDLPFVFDRFYRGDKSRISTTGSGLGLGIVKQIIEKHHGQVTIRSSRNIFTEVLIKIPKVGTYA